MDTRLRGYDGGREAKRGKLDTRLRGYDGGRELKGVSWIPACAGMTEKTKRGQFQNECSDLVLVMSKFLGVLLCLKTFFFAMANPNDNHSAHGLLSVSDDVFTCSEGQHKVSIIG